jgi:hypothetical protein
MFSRLFRDAAADLRPILDEHSIPHESWSRIGDYQRLRSMDFGDAA